MSGRISLALAIHNHQPVGNFGWVFAEVYEQAYLPMLAALERHPSVRLSLHYTGPLLEWLARERRDFLERLAALVRRGQVELLGGGLYEPVLASLPERDRVAQLRRMADAVEAIAGTRPQGAWLAERVWEPDVPTSLVDAGYRWTILDDAHFRAAAIPEDDLWGPYTTEDQGRLVSVFGTEQGLRYLIPFRPVEEVIAYLQAHATAGGERVGMMGDDGEKFGAWPTTYEHCWGGGRWVDRFFEALDENASWLTTVTPSDWLATHPPIGRVYLPTGSYAEMGEWALPPDEAVVFAKLLHEAREDRRPEARWLRGAFWRNFQVKYREINDLHKQMLRASGKVDAMEPGPARDLAMDHLHRGQSNDCYWHGLFGGIYISHMRLATYEHLIAAEDLADGTLGQLRAAVRADLDLDGRDEVLLADPGQVVAVKPEEGAGIGSWDIRAARHALAAVLRRRPEAYHERLRTLAPARATAGVAGAGAGGLDEPDDGVTSIHELVQLKEPDLAERLFYDRYERRSGLVRLLAPGATPDAFARGTAADLADLATGAWDVVELGEGHVVTVGDGTVSVGGYPQPLRATKRLTLSGDRLRPVLVLEVELDHRGDRPFEARFGVEWAIHLLGGGGNPSAWYEVAGGRSAHDASGTAAALDRIGYGNDWVGVAVEALVSPAADAWWSPIETISNSEAGFERVYQGSALLLSQPVRLAPGDRQRIRVEQRVTVARDRTAEEIAAAAAGAERA